MQDTSISLMIELYEDNSIIERWLCPNLCQCTKYSDKVCDKCGEELESIGFLSERDMDIELGKRQIIKFTQI
jgi:hypothetical protein